MAHGLEGVSGNTKLGSTIPEPQKSCRWKIFSKRCNITSLLQGLVELAVEMVRAVEPGALPLMSRTSYPPLALLLFQSSAGGDWYRALR